MITRRAATPLLALTAAAAMALSGCGGSEDAGGNDTATVGAGTAEQGPASSSSDTQQPTDTGETPAESAPQAAPGTLTYGGLEGLTFGDPFPDGGPAGYTLLTDSGACQTYTSAAAGTMIYSHGGRMAGAQAGGTGWAAHGGIEMGTPEADARNALAGATFEDTYGGGGPGLIAQSPDDPTLYLGMTLGPDGTVTHVSAGDKAMAQGQSPCYGG